MKALLFVAGICVLAVGALSSIALASIALAEGPRASSENNWAGMRMASPEFGYETDAPAYRRAPASHYIWQEGYDHGGKWHGHWVLVQ